MQVAKQTAGGAGLKSRCLRDVCAERIRCMADGKGNGAGSGRTKYRVRSPGSLAVLDIFILIFEDKSVDFYVIDIMISM